VLGTVNGTTIAAGQVIVQPTSATPAATKVVPFQRGAAVHGKAGRSNPRELQPGVGNDRRRNGSEQGDDSCAGRLPRRHRRPCRELSNGEYEVHNIGVNWPHHIFVNQTFKVVGAN
jgi:hypothetical protein